MVSIELKVPHIHSRRENLAVQGPVVVRQGSSQGGCFSDHSLSRPNVLVRHFRSGLGRDRHRPIRSWSLFGGQGSPLQSLGACCDGEGSLRAAKVSSRPSCRSVLGQHHNFVVREERSHRSSTRWLNRFFIERSFRISRSSLLACSRPEQCSRRRSVSSQSGDWGRVDTSSGGLRYSSQVLAGDNRPVCFLSQSPLWCLLAIPVGYAIWDCSRSFFFFFFFPATILSGPYLWNRYSQRLQIECAAWSCSLILHGCLPSNSLRYFFFFPATILSGPYLWNRYSQRLQIECAAWSCGLILHCCLLSNSLRYLFIFFFFFRHDFVRAISLEPLLAETPN